MCAHTQWSLPLAKRGLGRSFRQTAGCCSIYSSGRVSGWISGTKQCVPKSIFQPSGCTRHCAHSMLSRFLASSARPASQAPQFFWDADGPILQQGLSLGRLLRRQRRLHVSGGRLFPEHRKGSTSCPEALNVSYRSTAGDQYSLATGMLISLTSFRRLQE